MTARTTFLILLAGPLTVTGRLRAQVAGTRVIAADGGMEHAEALAVTPELWVGDFDSSTAALRRRRREIPQRRFASAKDRTDGEIAIDAALERGGERLILAGAFAGPRSDHAFAHVTLALALAARGIDVLLTSGVEEGWPLRTGKRIVDLPPSSPFSILAATPLSGLSIGGGRYGLDKADMAFGSSRPLSNVAEGPVTVSLEDGMAILIARPGCGAGR